MIDCELRYGASTAFAFFSNNRRSREFKEVAEVVLAHRSVSIGRVDGKMSAAERAGVLAPLRQSERAEGSALRLVTNCRVLREGTDVPAVDLVVFGDERQSHVDILQSMARASRVSPGKACCFVLVPVPEEGDRFETVLSVMRAYAEQDEELLEALRKMATQQARASGEALPFNQWPGAVRRIVEFPGEEGASLKLTERMVATVAKSLADGRDWWFGMLLAFYDREGHCDVPSRHVESGANLGDWLNSQRKRCKLGLLSVSRKQRLEELGVKWDVLSETWEANFGLLRRSSCARAIAKCHMSMSKAV